MSSIDFSGLVFGLYAAILKKRKNYVIIGLLIINQPMIINND